MAALMRTDVARIRGAGAMTPTPFWAHAMRADSGRPSSSMRFRTWTAHVHLSRPTLIRTRAQPVPDHALEPADGGLGPGARVFVAKPRGVRSHERRGIRLASRVTE